MTDLTKEQIDQWRRTYGLPPAVCSVLYDLALRAKAAERERDELQQTVYKTISIVDEWMQRWEQTNDWLNAANASLESQQP